MPAVPVPTMQTSALIFLSSAGIDGSFDVADQSDTPSSEIGELCDTDRTARRREGTCAIAFSPDIQLLPTTINDDRTMGRVRHVTVRILIRLFPKVAFATASLSIFPVLPNNAGHASHGTPHLQAFPLSQSEVCMTTARCRL